MNILHISSASQDSGAGSAAVLTHKTLIEVGVNSRLLFLIGDESPGEAIFSATQDSLFKKVKRTIVTKLDQIPLFLYPKRKKQIFSPGLFGLSLTKNMHIQWADVIHLHWINHGFVDIKEIKRWNRPIVWTLRDMWAFTGGCHYSYDCVRFKFCCGACPVLRSSIPNDLSKRVLDRKKNILPELNIFWVAISSWIRDQAISSSLLKSHEIDVVFSGISKNDFYEQDKVSSRKALGLPLDKKIILVGASNLADPYKGMSYLLDTINNINIEILLVAFGSTEIERTDVICDIKNFGVVNDKSTLRALYNSADVFLGTSIYEAFGKTYAEAQFCGLPVVCFSNTGPEDIVEHRVSGYIANYKDFNDLIRGINFCLMNDSFDKAGIIKRANSLFDISISVREYLKIYEKSFLDWSNS